MASHAIFILATAFLGSAAGSILSMQEGDAEAHAAFAAYRLTHNREYKHGTAEYDMRKALFEKRLAEVNAHNAKGKRWKEALNHFSDRTDAERQSVMGYTRGASSDARGHRGAGHHGGSLLQVSNSSAALPESKDWMHLKSASFVKDQGECGSCWAVTTTSVLESHYEIYSANGGKIRSFSAQATLECTPNPKECGGKGGCQGATVELGMDYIVKHGIATDDQVPYRAHDGKCSAKSLLEAGPAENAGAAFGLVGYHMLERNSDSALAEAVAKYGPVAISAAADTWMGYSSGVFSGCDQDAIIGHAITLYGYGTDTSGEAAAPDWFKLDGNTDLSSPPEKYWLIRNSWGKTWGENGFIRIKRDAGYCGMDSNNQEGTGCKADAKAVKICGMCGMLFDSVVPHFRGSPGHTDSFEEMSTRGSFLMRMKAEQHNSD